MECSFAGQWCLSNSGSLSNVSINANNNPNNPNPNNNPGGSTSGSSSSSNNTSDNKQSYGFISSICHYNEYEVACGTTSGYIFIFDTRSNSLLYKWEGHESAVFQILCWNKHSLITIGSDNLYLFYIISIYYYIFL